MNTSLGVKLRTTARALLFAAIFFTPVIALPWTSEAFELNKQTVLVVLILLAAMAWLGSAVAEKIVHVRAGWLLLLPLLFLLSTAISAALSAAPYMSWFGQNVQEYTSFLSIAAFVFLFFAGSHLLSEPIYQRRVWSVSLVASGAVSLLVLPVFVGVNLPFTANVVGTPNTLALYLLVMSLVGCALWLTSSNQEGVADVLPRGVWGVVTRIAWGLTAVTAVLALLAIDYVLMWALVLVGVGLVFAAAMFRAKEFTVVGKFVPPMVLFVIAVAFLILPAPFKGPFPTEVSTSWSSTWEITTQTLRNGQWLQGSGPGTFAVDYLRYQSAAINDTVFWDTTFDRGHSHILTMLATFGLPATVIFVIFVLTLAVLAVRRLLTEKRHEEWRLTFIPFVGWVILVIALALTYQSFTTAFMFWLVSTCLASQVLPAARVVTFAKSQRTILASTFVLVLLCLGAGLTLYMSVTRYMADIAFAQAVAADRSDATLNEVINKLDRAASLNQWSDTYYRNLASALFLQTVELLKEQAPATDTVQSTLGAAVNSAKRATDIAPANVSDWKIRGDIYREVAPIVVNADAFAIASFERAVALAPANPKYQVGLARAYIVRADLLAPVLTGDDAAAVAQATRAHDEALVLAESALNYAIELKGDYVPASYYLAFVQERQGELADAVKSMEAVRAANPKDLGVGIQLALLYLRQGKNEVAKAELVRILEIAPTFANAHWYLSVIYEKEENLPAAIAEVEAVLKHNPDIEAVKQRLERLQQGIAVEVVIPEPLEVQTETVVEEVVNPVTP